MHVSANNREMRAVVSAPAAVLAVLAVLCAPPAASALSAPARAARIAAAHPRLESAAPPPPRAPRNTPGSANCTTLYFDQLVDHFSWLSPPTGPGTWRQRYLINDSVWRNDSTGAIFFYVGNEGPVTNYADHTGLMWENAAAAGALIVFAEHR